MNGQNRKRIEIRLVPLILVILIICAIIFVLFFKILPNLNSEKNNELSTNKDSAQNETNNDTTRLSSNSAINELYNNNISSNVITNDNPNGIKKEISCKVDSVLDLKIYHLNNNKAEAEIISNNTEMYILGLEINKKYEIQNLNNVKDVYCYTTGNNSEQVCIFLLNDGTIKLLDYTKLNSTNNINSVFAATNPLANLSNVQSVAQQAVIDSDGSGKLEIFAQTSDSENMINITNMLKTARELGLCS